jgi:PKD domain
MLESAMPFKGLLRYPGIILLACFTLNAAAITHYVDVNSPSPSSPYTSWATASTNIQTAVDAAANGDLILVTNGVYQTGGAITSGSLSNRVAVNKLLTIQSVNGPLVTMIKGYQLPSTTNGDGAVRCVYLTNGASLIGFTVTNGATRGSAGGPVEQSGGGIFCGGNSSIISNCIITGNSAYNHAGGAYLGSIIDSTITGNYSRLSGAGAYQGYITNCILTGNITPELGGGADLSTLSNSVVQNNISGGGAGASNSKLNNCTVSGNSSTNRNSGGGLYLCSATNCFIAGNFATSGGGASGGILYSCIISNNSAGSGGGVASSTVYNCQLLRNSAITNGGGALQASIVNSTIFQNYAANSGGGVYGGAVSNSTITANTALHEAGGANACDINNSIVYYNHASYESNFHAYSTLMKYCCTAPLPPDGFGNITNEPQLASISHLSSTSPCRGKGLSIYSRGLDVDGQPWASPPSIGCDEIAQNTFSGNLNVAIACAFTNIAAGFPLELTADIQGNLAGSVWNFGDGTTATNQPFISHIWSQPGDYTVTLTAINQSQPSGMDANLQVHVVAQPIHYVDLTGSAPASPFTSWTTAATNIQDAVDAASVAGSMVLVTNGVYATGGRSVFGNMTNRVAVTKPIILQSVNGPLFTTIQGLVVPGITNGNGAIRCVYLTNGATLIGFTITNGATRTNGDLVHEMQGGGIWCESPAAVVSNCWVVGNSAANGGGVFSGTINNSRISGNTAASVQLARNGGGAYFSTLNDCLISSNSAYIGGAVEWATCNRCILIGNTATMGGAVSYGFCNNSLVISNFAYASSAAYGGTLNNCTITYNSGVDYDWGTSAAVLTNCIVYYNNTDTRFVDWGGTLLDHCCIPQLPTNGVANFTNPPVFVDAANGNFHLQPNSPCINAGNNAANTAAIDFDGNPRTAGGTVDIGAYEFQNPATTISQLWLQQYGLATDGSADFTDSDHDGLNNWQEWIAGTDPTDPKSALYLHAVTTNSPGLLIQWDSVLGKLYSLERASNLSSSTPFAPIASQISGNNGTTTYLDTNAIGNGPFFYRIRTGQ